MDLLLGQARQLIDLRRYDDAERLIDRALAEEPESALAHILRARIGIAREDWTTAREAARTAASSSPHLADVHALLALAVLNDTEYEPDHRLVDWLALRSGESRRLAEALYHSNRAIELEPQSPYLHGIRGRVLWARQEFRAALSAADAGLAIDPSDATCRLVRHDALVYLGRDQDATRFTTDGLTFDPNDELSHQRLGQLALERGDFVAAFEHARAALEVDPNFGEAQSVYWSAAAHLGPGVATLARIRGACLRILRWPIRLFVASPNVMAIAVIIGTIALIALACRALQSGHLLLGWLVISLLSSAVGVVAVPLLLWACLHLLLIVRRRDRRASIVWERLIIAAATAGWIGGYTLLSFFVLDPSRPSFFVPPLLATCPIVLIFLGAAAETISARVLYWALALAAVALAVIAFAMTRGGDREAQFRCLMISGALTLLIDSAARRLDRRRRPERSRGGNPGPR